MNQDTSVGGVYAHSNFHNIDTTCGGNLLTTERGFDLSVYGGGEGFPKREKTVLKCGDKKKGIKE